MAETIDGTLSPLLQAAQLMKILRGPNGCNWDRAQNFEDIAPYTIEEAYEVMDAIETGDMAELQGELGDLLFQVLFHSEIAREHGHFDLNDVCTTLVRKMVSRHPHVFDDGDAPDWEDQKEAERSGRILDGVALALPALLRAQKLQKRAARVGFDWPDVGGVYAKITEEIGEVKNAETDAEVFEEIGDLLFSVVNLSRHYGVDAESALRAANAKFQCRFGIVEERLDLGSATASLEQMEEAWQSAKL